jgi:hypothetical protein
MCYPYRGDYQCPECKTGTMKWHGMEFHSNCVLGMSFCDNPDCVNHEDNWLKPFPQQTFEALLTKAAQPIPAPEQSPDSENEKTMVSETSGGCCRRTRQCR